MTVVDVAEDAPLGTWESTEALAASIFELQAQAIASGHVVQCRYQLVAGGWVILQIFPQAGRPRIAWFDSEGAWKSG